MMISKAIPHISPALNCFLYFSLFKVLEILITKKGRNIPAERIPIKETCGSKRNIIRICAITKPIETKMPIL